MVGERQIGEGLDVDLLFIVLRILHVAVEPEIVLIIAVEPSRDGVVVVQHRRDAVEAKPVDVELLDEVEDLSQEELHHLTPLHEVDHDEQSGLVDRVDQSLQCEELISHAP